MFFRVRRFGRTFALFNATHVSGSVSKGIHVETK